MSTVRAPLQIGDTIRFTRAFLQSMATVSWADGATTQVNVTNLEVQPGNPPLTPR